MNPKYDLRPATTERAFDDGANSTSTNTPSHQPSGQTGKGKRPTSPAKIASSRQNSFKSTGPRSREGKRRSSRNALDRGLFSRWLVILDPAVKEDPEEWRSLRAEIAAHYKPVGFEEELRCEEIAVAIWQRRRLLRYDSGQIARSLAQHRSIVRTTSSAQGDAGVGNDPELDAITDHLLLLSKEDLDRRSRSDSLSTKRLNFAIAEMARLKAERAVRPNG